jgi:hypothetical protein
MPHGLALIAFLMGMHFLVKHKMLWDVTKRANMADTGYHKGCSETMTTL